MFQGGLCDLIGGQKVEKRYFGVGEWHMLEEGGRVANWQVASHLSLKKK